MSQNTDDAVARDVRWAEGALTRMERAPIFLRGMVRRLAEKKARELGYAEITEATLEKFKSKMMGGMGGASGMTEAAEAMAQGRLPWTAAAKERLNTVPEFMRGMNKKIAEEVAKEGGHMEVNVDLVERVEALGDVREAALPPLPWTEGAQARLREKLQQSPPIAIEFVTDMLKRDTEDLAREKGLAQIDEQSLIQLWEAPQEQIACTDEAWKRLQTSPDFVRSGIRKAAERRARKLGLKENASPH